MELDESPSDELRGEGLGSAYADAWQTWAVEEAGAWEATVGDGLTSCREGGRSEGR
jgi:hypothetical protein